MDYSFLSFEENIEATTSIELLESILLFLSSKLQTVYAKIRAQPHGPLSELESSRDKLEKDKETSCFCGED